VSDRFTASPRARRATLLSLGLARDVATPLHRQLYDQLREAILAGRLAPGARLPSTRALATELGLSRNTVATAFEQLLSEGYVEGRVGAGTYVSPVLPETLLGAAGPAADAAGGGLPARPSQRGEAMAAVIPQRPKPQPAFALAAAELDPLAAREWGRAMVRYWRHPSAELMRQRDPSGWRPLRAAIAAYLGAVRAVRCDPEQVMIVSGAQAGLDLAARLLLDPGESAWVEEPGYPGLRAALLAAGAVAVPVPVDGEGLSVATGRTLAGNARLAAVTPSHQFPLGVTMSLARRLALLEWARETGAWILEDDYDSEYRYAGRPLAALQGLDQEGRVIYVGTFSKVMFPSLRLGYLVLPQALVDLFRRARAAVDDHASAVAQAPLADFIESGQFAAHLRRARARYAERRAVLIEAIESSMGGLLVPAPGEGGLHLLAGLSPAAGIGEAEAVRRAAAGGLTVTPLANYYSGPPDRCGLLLGFGSVDEARIRPAVQRLARALTAPPPLATGSAATGSPATGSSDGRRGR